MSERELHCLSQQLRLLARANVKVSADGRRVFGALDQRIEDCRQTVLEALYSLQDHKPLKPCHRTALAYGQEITARNRELITLLRREVTATAA